MDELAKKILAALKAAGKPVRPAELAETLKVDSKDLAKALKQLKTDGKIISPKACFYGLPE